MSDADGDRSRPRPVRKERPAPGGPLASSAVT